MRRQAGCRDVAGAVESGGQVDASTTRVCVCVPRVRARVCVCPGVGACAASSRPAARRVESTVCTRVLRLQKPSMAPGLRTLSSQLSHLMWLIVMRRLVFVLLKRKAVVRSPWLASERGLRQGGNSHDTVSVTQTADTRTPLSRLPTAHTAHFRCTRGRIFRLSWRHYLHSSLSCLEHAHPGDAPKQRPGRTTHNTHAGTCGSGVTRPVTLR